MDRTHHLVFELYDVVDVEHHPPLKPECGPNRSQPATEALTNYTVMSPERPNRYPWFCADTVDVDPLHNGRLRGPVTLSESGGC
ncbi:MAG: hypothetical protein M3O70_24855 [Actinomycetota bacterium]|nr:hypothetical protein [Actinomycetota bacterium]